MKDKNSDIVVKNQRQRVIADAGGQPITGRKSQETSDATHSSAETCKFESGDCMTISEHLEPFLDQLGGSQSPRNRELYTLRLKLFLKMFGDHEPAAVTAADVQRWLSILDQRNYAETTMAGYRQAAKTFFNFLVDEEVIDRSPIRKLRTAPRVQVSDLVADKLPPDEDVATACALATRWMLESDRYRNVRDGVMFRLSRCCGLRRQELQRLKLSAVKRALKRGINQYGFYSTGGSRGKTGEIIARFDEETAAGLRRYLTMRPKQATINVCFVPGKRTRLESDDDLRWRMLSESTINSAYARLCEAAGVSPIQLHIIRHWLGTKTTREQDPKTTGRLFNHRDKTGATALRYYAHVDDSDIGNAINGNGYGNSAEIDAMSNLFRVTR